MRKKIIDLIFELKSGCFSKEESIRKKLKLSPAEFRGILVLTPKTIISCNLLSKKMGLSISRGSRVVEKMLKNGYLKEVKKKGDKRFLNVTLASKGEKIRLKISEMLEDCEKIIEKKITGKEIETLIGSLYKITNILIHN